MPDLLLQRLGQGEHPVDDGEQVDHALAFPALFVEQSHQFALGGKSAADVAAGSQGTEVRDRHQGEGVGLALQRCQIGLEVQQLRRRKTENVFAAQHIDAVLTRPPPRAVVGQHRKTRHRLPPAVDQPVVIAEHPRRKSLVTLRLHLHVHVQQPLGIVSVRHPHQQVHELLAAGGIAHHLVQFLVQKLVALGPVDGVVRRAEVKGHELGERALDGLFPGNVVLVGGAGFGLGCGRHSGCHFRRSIG